jgi:hypothetical protein
VESGLSEQVDRLLSIASPPVLDAVGPFTASPDVENLVDTLLSRRNGFYAFESALHVFPSGGTKLPERSLGEWNSPLLWAGSYESLAPRGVAFAEDIFAGQFILQAGRVYSFNPETAELSLFADDLAGWCEGVLARYNYVTGWKAAHDWQVRRGRLRVGHRLIARLPFFAGGEFTAENVLPVEAAAMRYWANIAKKISGVPDGRQVRFNPAVVEELVCDRGGVGSLPCQCFDRPWPAWS